MKQTSIGEYYTLTAMALFRSTMALAETIAVRVTLQETDPDMEAQVDHYAASTCEYLEKVALSDELPKTIGYLMATNAGLADEALYASLCDALAERIELPDGLRLIDIAVSFRR